MRLIAVGCKDIRLSKSGNSGSSSSRRLFASRTAGVAAAAAGRPFSSRSLPFMARCSCRCVQHSPHESRRYGPPLPDRHEPTALHPHLKEKKDWHKGTERNKQSWPISKFGWVHTRQLALQYVNLL